MSEHMSTVSVLGRDEIAKVTPQNG